MKRVIIDPSGSGIFLGVEVDGVLVWGWPMHLDPEPPTAAPLVAGVLGRYIVDQWKADGWGLGEPPITGTDPANGTS